MEDSMKYFIALLVLLTSAFAQNGKLVLMSPDGALMKTATAVDGKWVAIHKRARFSELLLPPGEHLVCVVSLKFKATPWALKINVESGKTYYLNQEYNATPVGGDALNLRLVEDYQARILLNARTPVGKNDFDSRKLASRDPWCR
jgi:hypothetical protein